MKCTPISWYTILWLIVAMPECLHATEAGDRVQTQPMTMNELTGIKSIDVFVQLGLPDDVPDGLFPSHSEIRTKTELALRRNGVPIAPRDGDDAARLVASVRVMRLADQPVYVFTVGLKLIDIAAPSYPRGPSRMLATIWPNPFAYGSTLGYGGSAVIRGTILDELESWLERFCNDYLSANPRPPARGMFDDLVRELRPLENPVTSKDAETPFAPIDGNTPDESPPLPPGFVLDSDPNEAESGFTGEDLDAMERTERERAAMERLNRLGLESLSNEDIENLPEEVIKKLPAIDLFARGLSRDGSTELGREVGTMMVELMLLELRFYSDIPRGKRSDRLLNAVREFQKAIDADPTGELLFGELDEMGKRCALLHPPKVHLPTDMTVAIYDDLAIIEGTWAFRGGPLGHAPLQTSKIHLNRRTQRGVEAIAQLWSFDEANTLNLDVDINEWEILRWDSDEIRAERVMTDLAQVSITMTVDVAAKSVRMFRLPKAGHEDDWPPQVLGLTKGWDVSWDFWQKRQDKASQMMAPAYREAMSRMAELLRKPSADPQRQSASPPSPMLPKGFVLDDPNGQDGSSAGKPSAGEIKKTQKPNYVIPPGGKPVDSPSHREKTEPKSRWMDDPVVERSNESLTAFLKECRLGSSPDFAIELQSTIEPSRWDHVITVHGLADDYAVCEKLVNYLNQTTNDRYRAIPLNK